MVENCFLQNVRNKLSQMLDDYKRIRNRQTGYLSNQLTISAVRKYIIMFVHFLAGSPYFKVFEIYFPHCIIFI